ncbi:hypothetical protein COHA_010278 [Chlorella ohadii]|uniref:MYND-type domain-containing protein n=1 Tax=Chlorella ohadii TaxID=2649997 RepID=A0AAD5GZU0_9CHLO|nr:hypothetical protein COHA_010278 [Chlorella ohadii]
MRAMAMAYWDALAAILDACGDDAEEFDAAMASQLLAGTATALFWCPPALAINLRLQAAVVKCLEIPPQAAMLQSSGGGRLLELVAASPHTAAVMVAEGMVDQLMQPVQASPAGSSGQLGWIDILHQLLSAADGVAQQPATAAGSEADAAAAVAEAAAELRSALNAESIEGHCLLPARRLAAALLAWWRRPAAQQAAVLESARAAAARSCAYLRCTNLGGEGGPAAGQGTGSKCCSACRAVWYCGTACSHADWRAGHRRVCQALGVARGGEKERRRQAAAAAAAQAAEQAE